MTDQAEKFKPKEATRLDSKVREASEFETREAGLHNEENKKIHDQTQARHKIGHSATDLMIPNQSAGPSLEMVDEEAGYVLTGKGYKPLVPEDISKTYKAILQDIPEVEDPALLPDKVAEATIEYYRAKGMIPDEGTSSLEDLQQQCTYSPDDQQNGSDSLPAISEDQAVNYRIRERSDNGMLIETGIQELHQATEQQQKPLDWLAAAQKIAQLPFDKQLQVIGAGLSAGINEYNHQQRERSIGALIGTVQGVGTIAVNLAKITDFTAALIKGDKEAAAHGGAEFGTAIGETIVGGVRLFEGAHHYLNDVGKAGYKGDYTKVFRDIDNLGKHLDKAWSELPPREQTRIISKLGTELATDGLVGLGAAKAAGRLPGQLTKILDTISTDAQRLHLAGKNLSDRSVRAIKDAVDDFLAPEFVTPDGQRIKLGQLNRPGSDKPDTSMLMSKADDVGGGKPENLGPRRGREIEPVDEKEVVNPIARTASTEQKVAQLMALSEQNKPLVERFLKNVDTTFDTKSEISVKTPQDILDKAKRPSIKETKEWFDVEHVRDSLRFKTPVDNLKDLPEIVKHLLDSGFEVVKLDLDKLIKPKGRGWRMAAIDLKAPNGQILEYQLLPTEMNAAGKIEHQMYKQWRSKDVSKLNPAELNQKREVDAAAADLYTDAWESYLKRSGQTQETIKEIIRKTNLVLEQ